MTYEIRAMSFSEIMDTAFKITRDHFSLLVGIAAILQVPIALVSAAIVPTQGAPDGSALFPILAGGALLFVYLSVAWPVVMAGASFAIGELYQGRVITIGDALRRGWQIIGALSGTYFLSILGTMGGLLLLIIPGVYLMLSWMLIACVMVFENSFGTRALRRSYELMRGNRWRGFGLFFVSAFAANLLTGVMQIALGYIPIVGTLAAAITQSMALAFTSAVVVLLYFDIRCRKDQFDVQHLAALVASQVGQDARIVA